MSPTKVGGPEEPDDTGSFAMDPVQVQKVKDILIVLSNAVSAAKIFPSDHQTVVYFLFDLHTKLREFLDENWKLELGIEEHAFVFGGERVYEDAHPVKSLPFFFYKDGMLMLYFYRGLEQEELKGFLETIRTVSQLPPEEADIVNSLWERDFANIRYLAPDDFLETKIGVGRKPLEVKVEKEELTRGKIELAPEDLAFVPQSHLSLEPAETSEPGMAIVSKQDEIHSLLSSPDEKEAQEIESLLFSSRRISREEEYLNLIVELIYLEDRMDQLRAISEVLKEYHQESLRKKEFELASRLLKSLHEIRDIFEKSDKNKTGFVESIIREIGGENTLASLGNMLETGLPADEEGLLSYLRMIGPPASLLIAEVFERSKEPHLRKLALQILKEIGQKDPEVLMRLAQESKPSLTKEIILLLSETGDKKNISFLAGFLRSRNKMIKLAAIRALAEIEDSVAGKVVLGFLSDDDEDIRVSAAQSLRWSGDKMVMDHILELARNRAFLKKSAKERKAILDFLADSGSGEALSYLRRVLQKTTFFPNASLRETCLLAIESLAKTATLEAEDVLKEGARRRSKKIREACWQALQNIHEKDTSSSKKMIR